MSIPLYQSWAWGLMYCLGLTHHVVALCMLFYAYRPHTMIRAATLFHLWILNYPWFHYGIGQLRKVASGVFLRKHYSPSIRHSAEAVTPVKLIQ